MCWWASAWSDRLDGGGTLGILKVAGGAYVPLTYQERLAEVLEDASVPVLLTQQQMRPVIPSLRARLCLLIQTGR